MEFVKGDSTIINNNPAFDKMFMEQGYIPIVENVKKSKPNEEKIEEIQKLVSKMDEEKIVEVHIDDIHKEELKNEEKPVQKPVAKQFQKKQVAKSNKK